MVTKSTKNYEQWKIDVKEHYLNLFPKYEKQIDSFMKSVSDSYDGVKRSFFSYKILWYLFDRRKRVTNKNQHYWIAFIGQKGGEGKSTLAKNMLYYLDNTFTSDTRASMNFDDFIQHVSNCGEVDFPAVLLDEVDPTVHQLSKVGRALQGILTKIRQLNLCVGVCANNLNDVPKFVKDRLTAIVYISDNHRFTLWDTIKDKNGTIIEDIKKEWKDRGHSSFKLPKFTKRAVFSNQSFSKELPFKEDKYDAEKKKDLMNDIKAFINPEESKPEVIPPPSNETLVNILIERNPEFSSSKVAESLGISKRWVEILRKKRAKNESAKEYNNIMGGESTR